MSTWLPVDTNVPPLVNLLGQPEPVANNGACERSEIVPGFEAGAFGKAPGVPRTNGAGVLRTSTVSTAIIFSSLGTIPYRPGAQLCDKWDNSRFRPSGATFLTDDQQSYTGPVVLEFGTGNWGPATTDADEVEWFRQAHGGCTDGETLPAPNASYSSADVDFDESHAAAVAPATVHVRDLNMVRITFQSPITGIALFLPTWTMLPGVPLGEEHRNYTALFRPDVGTTSTSDCSGRTLLPGPVLPASRPASRPASPARGGRRSTVRSRSPRRGWGRRTELRATA